MNKKEEDIIDKQQETLPSIEYFSLHPIQLALYSIFTLGVYDIYWFYRNWYAIKVMRHNVHPFGRAFFTLIFCYQLFKEILTSASAKGYQARYSAKLLALMYIVLVLIGNIWSRLTISSVLIDLALFMFTSCSFLPLIVIQDAINFQNSKIKENFSLYHTHTKWEILILIGGFVVFSLAILGMIFK